MDPLQAMLGELSGTPTKTAIVKRSPFEIEGAPDNKSLLAGALCSIAGAFFWKKHRYLGFFGLGPIGIGVTEAVVKKDIKAGIPNVAAGALGIAGARYFKKHPAIAFVGAGAVGQIGGAALLAKLSE